MKCPSCSTEDSKVVDSRSIQGGESIRRRRECNACNFRYTTYEYVLENPVKVIKKSGEREEYDRAKLEKSFSIACEKRPIPEEKIQQAINRIEEKISDKTKAILISPVLGNPPDFDVLMEIKERYDLELILDDCDSLGLSLIHI